MKGLLTFVFAAAVWVSGVASADTFVVNSTDHPGDGVCEAVGEGDCTLFEAVAAANGNPGSDVVSFADLPGTGPWDIVPDDQLELNNSDGLLIDGWTAPGWAGAPLVRLDGSNVSSARSGFFIRSSNNTIRGLVLSGYSESFGFFGGTDNHIAGNYLGTDITGSKLDVRQGRNVDLGNSAATIVGTNGDGIDDEFEGNVIAISSVGIGAFGTDHVIAGNLIGTDAAGANALGSLVPGSRGILVGRNSPGTRVGTNGDGISDDLEGNLISGSGGVGIEISSSDTVVAGNLIGTDITGCAQIPNALNLNSYGAGIWVQPTVFTPISGVLIGGDQLSEANVIAYNAVHGIVLFGQPNVAVQAELGINFIYRNGGSAINLVQSSTDPDTDVNDDGDLDEGVNGLQNYPVLDEVVQSESETRISGTLNSQPDTEYEVQLYASAVCGRPDKRQMEYFLDSLAVTTDDDGIGNFSIGVAPVDPVNTPFITAIATDPDGNTSEVSACLTADDDEKRFRDTFESPCRLPGGAVGPIRGLFATQ